MRWIHMGLNLIMKKTEARMFTLFTYEQLDIAFLKQGYCKGNNSWAADRSADAAITEGLNSKSLISANEIKMSELKQRKNAQFIYDFFFYLFFFWVLPFWALNMISVARALRACLSDGSFTLNKEVK